MVERILLLINRSAGTACSDDAVSRVRCAATEFLGKNVDLQVEVVGDHQEVAACTTAFLAASHASAAVIAGGGGGTLRAAIEAICNGNASGRLPGEERVRVAALRMGSGNVLARQFGVPRDPHAALKGIVANLRAGRTAPCCIMRFEIGGCSGNGSGDGRPATDVRFAATLGGFGQFGRVPGDLARWHRRLPMLHRIAARMLGIERLTDIEYGLALLVRFVWCALRPSAAEVVQVSCADATERMKLLAGVILNFPLRAVPLDPGVRVGDAALSVALIPFSRRFMPLSLLLGSRRLVKHALKIRIGPSDRLEIRLMDRDSVGFFLDEDPTILHDRMIVRVAGILAFVPGPDYRWPEQGGETL